MAELADRRQPSTDPAGIRESRLDRLQNVQYLAETFARVFALAEGRVIVATFASNISRIQQAIDAATRFERSCVRVDVSMIIRRMLRGTDRVAPRRVCR